MEKVNLDGPEPTDGVELERDECEDEEDDEDDEEDEDEDDESGE